MHVKQIMHQAKGTVYIYLSYDVASESVTKPAKNANQLVD